MTPYVPVPPTPEIELTEYETDASNNPGWLILAYMLEGPPGFHSLPELDKLLTGGEGDMHPRPSRNGGGTLAMAAYCKPGTTRSQVEAAIRKDLEEAGLVFLAIYDADVSSLRIENDKATIFMGNLL